MAQGNASSDTGSDIPPPPPIPLNSPTLSPAQRWKKIADYARSKPRTWAEHELEKIPAQRIIHHTYEHTTNTWSTQEGLMKMQTESFDRGAMRECYRMICTDPFGESHSATLDWKHIPASVAKKYLPVKMSQLQWTQGAKADEKVSNLTVSRAGAVAAFSVGEMVEANYEGSGSWYSAVVRAVIKKDDKFLYTVYYPDDDEEESNMMGSMLRRVKTASASSVMKAPTLTRADLEGKGNNVPDDDELVEVPRDAYFTDVTLLMATRPYEDLFNKNTGLAKAGLKRIHFLHAHVIEVICDDGPNVVLAAERFIPGSYIKHNSNTGFVEEHHRRTPQAFSHFSYVMSAGKEMVVDIQGVGDLWTDPQLHSTDFRYGSGDLGTNGMSLFFATHYCGGLCSSLGLRPFKLAPSQKRRLRRGELEDLCKNFVEKGDNKLPPELSLDGVAEGDEEEEEDDEEEQAAAAEPEVKEEEEAASAELLPQAPSPSSSATNSPALTSMTIDMLNDDPIGDLKASMELLKTLIIHPTDEDDDHDKTWTQIAGGGEVHLAMAAQHKLGRYSHDLQDGGAVIFHLHAAARHGEPQALWALACGYAGIPSDLLPVQPSKQDLLKQESSSSGGGGGENKVAPLFESIPEDIQIAYQILVALGNINDILLSKYGTEKFESLRIAACMRLVQLLSTNQINDDILNTIPSKDETSSLTNNKTNMTYDWCLKAWNLRSNLKVEDETTKSLFPLQWHEVASILGEHCANNNNKAEEASDWFTKAADEATEAGLYGLADKYMSKA